MMSELHFLAVVFRHPAARALDWVACGMLSLAWVAVFADLPTLAAAMGAAAAIAWRAADRLHGPSGTMTALHQVRSTALCAAVIMSTLILARILLDARRIGA
jgi:hypothetical protein